MNPRLVGALLVLAVVAVAISMPALPGRRTAGSALMVELPRNPQVGDCLLELPVEFSAAAAAWQQTPGVPATAAAGRRHPTPNPLGPAFAPCDGRPVAGEVAEVTVALTDPVTGRLSTPSSLDCRDAALRYAGLVPVDDRFVLPGAPANDPATWNLSVPVRASWVLPAPLLQAQHRTWAACVVAPREDVTYLGRFARAYDGGVLPDAFGTCWNKRTVSASFKRVDCVDPHLAELISAGRILDRAQTSSAELQQSCERLAARVVGRSDPTAGARLVLKTSPDRPMESIAAPSVSVLCYVVTHDRPLDATLVGLGEGPIPYAG
jgi:hypothetical protein